MTDQNFADQLIHCTIRIECTLPNNRTSTGSGFFYNYEIGAEIIPLIITNKHVIKNAIQGKLRFTVCDNNYEIITNSFQEIIIENFESSWIFHPDDNVDIAILSIQPFLSQLETQERKIYRKGFNKSMIATQDILNQLIAIENVIMVGYPNGIWDQVNNSPIIRQGITATPVYNDYNGKKEFMIDMACFPGSSGSPVLLYNAGMYYDKNGTTNIGARFYLLGILYAGPQHIIEGNLEITESSTINNVRPISRIPINLGMVIKSEKIFDFESIIAGLIRQ